VVIPHRALQTTSSTVFLYLIGKENWSMEKKWWFGSLNLSTGLGGQPIFGEYA
jgi:hypothetical protein